MDDYYDFDPDINIDYGKSPQGNEVLIINSREIFRLKKTGKRTLHGNFTLSWCCNNTSNCSATVTSSRVDVDLEGSDYNIVRKKPHSINCNIGRSEVVVLKHINLLLEQCKIPGINQQIQYEGILNYMIQHYPIESVKMFSKN
jgi:hypothetical protein